MRVNDIEVDGNEKITTTVDKINTVANFIPLNRSNKHFFLFDEVDNYSLEQQKRLKSCLNREDIDCVMTTNHIDKIDKGLQSRSHIICFNATHNTKNYVDRMKQIIRQNIFVGWQRLRNSDSIGESNYCYSWAPDLSRTSSLQVAHHQMNSSASMVFFSFLLK